MSRTAAVTFGAALRQYRTTAGLSQEGLAAAAGLTRNAVSALERGVRRHPFPRTVRALAAALRLTPEQQRDLASLARPADMAPPIASVGEGPLRASAPDTASGDRPLPSPMPAAPNPLLGRDEEHRALLRLVTDHSHRLVTLHGPGGAGKTRLAVEVATDLAGHFADGVAWVALASIPTADHVPAAIADALGEPLRGAIPPADQLLAMLRRRTLLLVLDNMEHLLEATDLVATILARVPSIQLLVTSRERLRIAGEWVVDLHGLALATGTSDDLPAAANELFVARARQVCRTFAPGPADHAAIARICRLVQGLPLAIELAAAWIGTLTAGEIADEIAQNLDMLARADRDAPLRHRSMRAVFDHSWRLLSERERRVLARLAVFRGGFTRAAAAAVAGASLPELAALVDKALVRRAMEQPGMPRYDLHELLRQYALAELETWPDEAAETYGRHCSYYASWLGGLNESLLSAAMSAAAREVAADLDNVRLAWQSAIRRRDYHALARMGQSVQVVSEIRGLFAESTLLFEEAVAALRSALPSAEHGARPAEPELLWALGHILSLAGIRLARIGRFTDARERLLEGFALQEQRGELLVQTGTLTWLGYLAYLLGAFDEAREWLERGIHLSRTHGDTFFLGSSHTFLAVVAQAQGAGSEALAVAQAGIAGWRVNGHPRGWAMGLWSLSSVLLAQGAVDAAEAAAREGLGKATSIADEWVRGMLLTQLGAIALARGDTAGAEALLHESLTIATVLGDPWGRCRALISAGWTALAQMRVDEARARFQEARDLGRATQMAPVALEAMYGLATLLAQEAPSAARAVLNEVIAHPAADHQTRTHALRLGQALGADEPTRSARGPDAPPATNLPGTGEALTARELEVLRLLGRGCSNQAIADELIVAVGTVKRHVNSILNKLDAHSRLEAVATARDLRLI